METTTLETTLDALKRLERNSISFYRMLEEGTMVMNGNTNDRPTEEEMIKWYEEGAEHPLAPSFKELSEFAEKNNCVIVYEPHWNLDFYALRVKLNPRSDIKIYYRSGDSPSPSFAYVYGCDDYETAKDILVSAGLMSDNLHWDNGFQKIEDNKNNSLYFPQPKDLYR